MFPRRGPLTLDDWTLFMFCAEIEARCHDAVLAAEILDAIPQDPSLADLRRAWFALRAILIAAAGISRLAGGQTGPRTVERARLRSLIGVDRHSALHNRTIRNHAEHVDSRIIGFVQGGGAAYSAHNFTISPSRARALGGNPLPKFLNFDPATGMISFWDDEIAISEVLVEIRRILPLAQLTPPRQPPHNV